MDHNQRGHGWQLREGTSVCPRRKRGAKTQAIGLSRGGQTTKVHALTDTLGRPVALHVTAGNVSDITMAETLLAEIDDCRYVLMDGRGRLLPPQGRPSRRNPIRQVRQNFLSTLAIATILAYWT
jgi:Transposase DDE domain